MTGPVGPQEAMTRALEALSTGALLADERGCIISVNTRCEEFVGRPASDLIGQDAHDLLHRTSHGDIVQRAHCPFREIVLGGGTEQGSDAWIERGDGETLRTVWLITPWGTEEGPSGTLCLFRPAAETAEAADTAETADTAEAVETAESGGTMAAAGKAGEVVQAAQAGKAAQAGEATGAETSTPPASPPPVAAGRLSDLERLALLAETTTLLTSTLDIDVALRHLIGLVLPRLADWAVIDLITERDEVQRFAVAHARDGIVVFREDLQGPMPPVPQESSRPLSRALRGVASTVAGPETYQGPPDSGIAVEQRRLFEATGMHSAVIVPLRTLHEVLGALTLGRADQPEPITAADISLAQDIARRAGLALENARLYQRQRKISETMQRHLLPQLPHLPGMDATVRYLPAPDASQVGGDWYDAFILPDSAVALAVGDVVGHDLDAAAGMAQMRSMLRAYALSQRKPPSRIVEWLDEAALHVAEVAMVTLIFARMTKDDDGRWSLCWTNAGHPPPLLITREGIARYLNDGSAVLLGVTPDQDRPDATVELPPGATLLLYTDGLIESVSHTLDEGLERLRRHAASLVDRPLDSFTDELLARVRPSDNDDDVALLVLRTPDSPT